MDINIDFFACSQSFLVSFSSLFSRVARYAPSKKTKNLLKNHLTTLAKSNDRFGIMLHRLSKLRANSEKRYKDTTISGALVGNCSTTPYNTALSQTKPDK